MEIKLKKNLIHEKLGNKIVLLCPDNGKFFELNSSASFIFENILVGAQKRDILVNLSNEFDIDETEACNDFDIFVRSIKEAGFVEK